MRSPKRWLWIFERTSGIFFLTASIRNIVTNFLVCWSVWIREKNHFNSRFQVSPFIFKTWGQVLERRNSVCWISIFLLFISNHLKHLKWFFIKRIAQNHSQVSKMTSQGFKVFEKKSNFKGENVKTVIMNFWANFRWFFFHHKHPEYCHELFGMLECMDSREKSL